MDFACDRPMFTVMSYPGKQLECLFLLVYSAVYVKVLIGGVYSGWHICFRFRGYLSSTLQQRKLFVVFAVFGPIDHHRPLGVTPPSHSQ